MNPVDTLAALASLAHDTMQPVPSPCISVCRIDESSGLCIGCYRSITEIIDWGRQTDARKRSVWRQIAVRAGLAQGTA